MTKGILLVLCGFLAGAAASYLSQKPKQIGQPNADRPVNEPQPSARIEEREAATSDEGSPDTVASRRPAQEPAAVSKEMTTQERASPNIPSRPSNRSMAQRPADLGGLPPPILPSAYEPLVQPPPARVMRMDELFDRFSSESRDEAWAYLMELGINQHIAGLSQVGTAFESIECRTSFCILAGYVQPGFANNSGEVIRGMVQAGWWQASFRTITSSSDTDGVLRFVTIVPRTEDDVMHSRP